MSFDCGYSGKIISISISIKGYTVCVYVSMYHSVTFYNYLNYNFLYIDDKQNENQPVFKTLS